MWDASQEARTVREFERNTYKSHPDLWRGDLAFHGTTPENAERIAKEGFRDDMVGSGHGAETEGHYFATTPEKAREYGPSVIAADISAVDVHPNPWYDGDVQEHMYSGGMSVGDAVEKAGWQGFQDEDGALVVRRGRNAHFVAGIHTSRDGETF